MTYKDKRKNFGPLRDVLRELRRRADEMTYNEYDLGRSDAYENAAALLDDAIKKEENADGHGGGQESQA